ncbi:MAG: ATP-binding cassette domain-containing protein [Deltaproteobacteria bacterium]|nr:ATP-binding cassette domain-containing protein [Deltaproteobacteria bacterium]
MSFLRLQNIHKFFNQVQAVNGVNLEVNEGEFFTLLGPSGCGKTTTLRMVGGLEEPDEGEILLGDGCLVSVSKGVFVNPEKRDMGMVFQSYALWPHMTVFENVAYPLKLRWMKKPIIREKVHSSLDLVGLAGLEDRPIPALSGGQQQRVALARALVFSPKVLLLDEPLSNLDAQLRDEMRRELKSLQRRVGVTVLFVTHDQIEALSLSDRIGIMSKGKLEQVGSPEEVYHKPVTTFARDFLGKTFIVLGKVVQMGDPVHVEPHGMNGASLWINQSNIPSSAAGTLRDGSEVVVSIRPDHIGVTGSQPNSNRNVLPATLESVHFLGDRYEYTVAMGTETRVLVLPASEVLKPGQKLFLELKTESLSLWLREM